MKKGTVFFLWMFSLFFAYSSANAQINNLHLFGDHTIDTAGCEVNKYQYTLANLNTAGSGNDIDVTQFTVIFDPNTICEPCSHSEPAGWTYAYSNTGTEAQITWTYTADSAYTLAAGSFLSGFIFHSSCREEAVDYSIQSNLGNRSGSVVGPVPVELLMFSVNVVGEGVKITWSTASETENAGFDVWRSEGNAESGYVKITRSMIPGAGNASEQNDYAFVDEDVVVGKTYYYKLADIDYRGTITFHGPRRLVYTDAPIAEFKLLQNYPNPFNPGTVISFELPTAAQVSVKIYDLMGREVRTLLDGKQLDSGRHSVTWDGNDQVGRGVAAGVYIYSLESQAGTVARKKLILVR